MAGKTIRKKFIKVRVTEEEKGLFEKKVKILGSNQSDLMRNFILGIPTEIKSLTDDEMVFQCRKMGVNVNEFLKSVNKNKPVNYEVLTEIFKDILQKLEEIVSLIKEKSNKK